MCSQSNIKVHFVLGDGNRFAAICRAAKVEYALFSCYGYIKNKSSQQNMKVNNLRETKSGFKHVIMDSGLFTLMFGADKNKEQTPEFIREWMHRICRFVQDNNIHASIVECDCQKLISPEYAWELRQEMRDLLPDREIINVFHLEDGKDGFEQLVDFTDYLAISVPELRIAQPKTYRKTVCALARKAKRMKPNIKIHLLGCTEKYLLEHNRFCTSSDSSSWTSGCRYGSFDKNNHISSIKPEMKALAIDRIKHAAKHLDVTLKKEWVNPDSTTYTWMAGNYWAAVYCRENYIRWAGNQD